MQGKTRKGVQRESGRMEVELRTWSLLHAICNMQYEGLRRLDRHSSHELGVLESESPESTPHFRTTF